MIELKADSYTWGIKTIIGGDINNYLLARMLIAAKHPYVQTKIGGVDGMKGPDRYDALSIKFGLDAAYGVIFTKGQPAFYMDIEPGQIGDGRLETFFGHFNVLKTHGFFKYISEDRDIKKPVSEKPKRMNTPDDGWVSENPFIPKELVQSWMANEDTDNKFFEFIDAKGLMVNSVELGNAMEYFSSLCIAQPSEDVWQIYAEGDTSYPITYIKDDIAKELAYTELVSVITNQRQELAKLRPDVEGYLDDLLDGGTF